MKHLHEMSQQDLTATVAKIAPELMQFMNATSAKHNVCMDCLHKLVFTMMQGYIEDAIVAIAVVEGKPNVRH